MQVPSRIGSGITAIDDLDEDYHFELLGQRFHIQGQPDNDATRLRLQALASKAVQDYIHFIPYAFGPVPVRATGDIISQPQHGLFGIIDVLPQGWDLPPESGTSMPPPPMLRGKDLADFGAGEWIAARPALGFGAPARFDAVALDPEQQAAPQRLREFVLFYQDGLNHHDSKSKIKWKLDAEPEIAALVANDLTRLRASGDLEQLTPDCEICDDSYDLGEQGVSYRSRPFASLLRFADIAGPGTRVEASDDLNGLTFPDLFMARGAATGDRAPLVLPACPGDQVVIRVVHPGGRARQRAFIMNGRI